MHVHIFTCVSMVHNKDEFEPLDLVKLKLEVKHTLKTKKI